jgi:peptidyl-prolyl cis-trans isomerase C
MKSHLSRAFILASLCFASTALPLIAQQADQTKSDTAVSAEKTPKIDFQTIKGNPVVARVNNTDITLEEVFKAIQGLPPQLRQVPIDLLFLGTRDQLVDVNLLREEAKKNKQKFEKKAEVKEAIEKAIEQIILQAYLDNIIEDRVNNKDIKAKYEELLKSVKQKTAEITKKYLKNFPANEAPDEVKIRQILVKTEEDANNILRDLKDGIDFLKLAREKSIDKETAKKDGATEDYINVLQLSQLEPGFAVLFEWDPKTKSYAIPVGKYTTSAIKTPQGYYILKVENRQPFKAPKFNEVKDMIRNQLAQETIEKFTRELKKNAKIERLHPNTGKPMKSLEEELQSMKSELEEKAKDSKSKSDKNVDQAPSTEKKTN